MEPRVNRKTRPETSAEFPKQSTLFDRMPEIPVKIEEQDCNVPGEIEKKCYKETHYITENEIIEETKASQEIGTLKETIQTTEKASLQELLNATIVGQVFDTYILTVWEQSVYN